MAKTIWFINDYAGSSHHGMEFRNYYFARELVKQGYEVYIITASYMHLFKKLPQVHKNYTFEKIDGINYLWIKVPKYGESTNKKRVLKWFIFTIKLFFLPLKKMKKPDIVIASPMAPFLALPAYRLAKRFNAKFIYEVKDIWPLSIIELGGFSPSHPLIRLMSYCERFALKKADHIVSSLQNYDGHMKSLGIDRTFTWVNNGIDLEEMKEIEPLSKEIEDKIPKDKFIIGYAGTVGIANALDSLCKVSKLLKEYKDIMIVIVGDGQEKENLQKEFSQNENILFIDAIPKKQVHSMLAYFDACYIGLKEEPLFKYGVSPNKLFDYMYSATPIIYAIDSGENNVVKSGECGVSIDAENPKAIYRAVLDIYNLNKNERREMGNRGRAYVLEHFTYSKLALKISKIWGKNE